jgi:hypothetical protein
MRRFDRKMDAHDHEHGVANTWMDKWRNGGACVLTLIALLRQCRLLLVNLELVPIFLALQHPIARSTNWLWHTEFPHSLKLLIGALHQNLLVCLVFLDLLDDTFHRLFVPTATQKASKDWCDSQE